MDAFLCYAVINPAAGDGDRGVGRRDAGVDVIVDRLDAGLADGFQGSGEDNLPEGNAVDERVFPDLPYAFSDGETARQMVLSVRLSSATTRLTSSGS